MAFSNAEKWQHGKNGIETLKNILQPFLDNGYLTYTREFRTGRENYDATQFYATFLVEFSDGVKWVLYPMASIRERIKEHQWDAFNLKAIDPLITAAYVVCPDAFSNKKNELEFLSTKNKHLQGEIFSPIDAVVSQSEMHDIIEEYAYRSMSVGRRTALRGKGFERRIAAILCNPQNIKKWKDGTKTIDGLEYTTFKKIVACLKLKPRLTRSIRTSSDIERLPHNRNPKTDVLVEVESNDGETVHYTISCKRSNRDIVTVHEGFADTFADILAPNDGNLRCLLNELQEAGGPETFERRHAGNSAALTRALKPHIKKLSMWALGGHGEGNARQCANYIVTLANGNNPILVHTINTYYNKLRRLPPEHFGTPFKWTRPSRSRKIQLKCRILE